MANIELPPEMEAFAEACGDAAMGPFNAADFDADPSAAFSDGMGAAMDFMSDAGMPTEMMDAIQELGSAAFDAHMSANPESSPMEAFDAVGGAVDMYMADFPGDMPCADCAMDMPPMPGDMGGFMDTCPPYGDHPGGENFDMGAMPDHYPGPMSDMGPGGPAIDPETGMAPQPPEGQGEGGYDDGPAPAAGDDMGPNQDMGPAPGSAAAGDNMGPNQDMGPGGPDPLFGEGGPAGGPPPGDMGPPPGDMGDHMGPPPGDMGPGGPDMPPPPDGMEGMQTAMDDAGAHHGPEGPPPGDMGPAPGADMPDMPPPPEDDPNAGNDGMA